jgi:hypothetical protein
MAGSFQIDTSTWRLPSRDDRPRITLPGAEELEVSSQGIRAKGAISSAIDTSSWTLPEREERKEEPKRVRTRTRKQLRAPGEPGSKDRKAPKDDRGKSALFGGAVGVHTEDLRRELRRLAGLERSEHIEFATGTPYRRLPDASRVEITEEVEDFFVHQPVPGRPVMTLEMRKLCGMVSSSALPHAIHDAAAPRTYRGAGLLNEDSKSGEEFVEEVLRESRAFFRDFSGLSLGAVSSFGEAPGGRRSPWRGNDDEEPPPWVMDTLPGENQKDPFENPQSKAVPVTGTEPAEGEPEEPEEEPEEPEEPEEEPPEASGEEEEEVEWVGEESGGPGLLKRAGGLLKRVGAGISGSKPVQRAKAKATGRIKAAASAFVKKHGIDTKRFYGTSDPKEAGKLKKGKAAKAAKKPSIRARVGALRQRISSVRDRSKTTPTPPVRVKSSE